MTDGLRHQYATVNGIRMHYVERGSGTLVVLLHGFPEFWYGWRNQIPVLAQHFRVVAPDLRGYNLTDKPTAGYDFETLSSDVPALIRALGSRGVVFVTYDEGSSDAHGGGHVLTIAAGPGVNHGRYSQSFDHYSLLQTNERMFGIKTFIGHAHDAATKGMRSAFGF